MLGQPFMERLSLQSVGAKGSRLSASLKCLDLHTYIKLMLFLPSGHIGVGNRNTQVIRNLFLKRLISASSVRGHKSWLSKIVSSAPNFLTTSTAAIAEECPPEKQTMCFIPTTTISAEVNRLILPCYRPMAFTLQQTVLLYTYQSCRNPVYRDWY